MTKEEILNMPAGEEIDSLVAEKVMGWHKGIYVSVIDGREFKSDRESWLDAEGHFMCGIGRYPEDDSENFHTIDWHPSDSILWAWDVVEMLKNRHVYLSWMAASWHCEIGVMSIVDADTASLAVCRAALLAMEAE